MLSPVLTPEEGTIPLVASLERWPPDTKSQLHQFEEESVVVKLFAYPDGRIELMVSTEERGIHRFESCPIEVTNDPNFLIIASWNENESTVRINGEELPSVEDEEESHKVSTKSVESEQSIGHPEAKERCQEWIERRRERWKEDLNLSDSSPQKLKSVSEQKGDLVRAISILMDDLDRVEEENLYRLDVVLSVLRSLICGFENHDPLLFRMAALKNLPLPVFSIETRAMTEELSEELFSMTDENWLGFHAGSDMSLVRRFEGQVLVDFQEWLEKPFTFRSTGRGTLTNHDLILGHASTSSLSHYHQYTYVEVELARKAQDSSSDLLTNYFYHVGRVVQTLGRYVVHEIV